MQNQLCVLSALVVLLVQTPTRATDSTCDKKRISYFQTVRVCTNVTDQFNSSIIFDASMVCVDCNVPVFDENTIGNFNQDLFNLSNSNVQTIAPTAFNNFGSDVHRLLLYNNRISSMPAGILKKFTALDEINLKGNELTDIRGLFVDIGLTTVDLSLNKISRLSDSFKNFSFVKLNLSYNLIETLEPNTFNSTRLWDGREKKSWYQEVALNNNKIRVIVPGTFSFGDQNKLASALYLQENQIEEIRDDTFSDLNRLRFLDLKGNQISMLHADSFKGLTGLETLKLSGNKIEKIPFGMFKDLQRLRDLDLDRNSISELQDTTFSGLSALTHLNLSHNRLKSISDSNLFPAGRLIALDISGNKLHRFDLEALLQHHNNLKIIAVNDNFWTCSDLVKMYKLLNRKSGVFDRPAKHYDVPNLHGIACSRVELENYDEMDFNSFLANIAEDRVFEDIYDKRLSEIAGPTDEEIIEELHNIRGIFYMMILITITCVAVFIRACLRCICSTLRAKNIITNNKFSFFYTPKQDDVQLL